MNKEEIEEYSTKNLNLAAYLCASYGIHFIGATKINEEFFFRFIPKPKAEELVDNYFLGKAVVNPQELFARLHDLRDVIFNQGE